MIKNKKGFTLIELIIVMAIIGILAVVAIVAISGKSVDARNARRLADLSAVQTGMALTCISATTTTVTCPAGNIGDEIALSTCTANAQLNFGTIIDPKGTGTTCTATPVAPCNYSVTLTTTTTVNSCDYDIWAALEQGGDVDGTNDIIHMTENAILRA